MELMYFIWALLLFILCFVVMDAYKSAGLSGAQGFWFSFLFTPLMGVLLGILIKLGAMDAKVVKEKAEEKADG